MNYDLAVMILLMLILIVTLAHLYIEWDHLAHIKRNPPPPPLAQPPQHGPHGPIR